MSSNEQGRGVHLRGDGPLSNFAPISGYDALGVEEIRTVLENVDATRIKKVAEYESRFANRRDVLKATDHAYKVRCEEGPSRVSLRGRRARARG
jgi:hypothetical protein